MAEKYKQNIDIRVEEDKTIIVTFEAGTEVTFPKYISKFNNWADFNYLKHTASHLTEDEIEIFTTLPIRDKYILLHRINAFMYTTWVAPFGNKVAYATHKAFYNEDHFKAKKGVSPKAVQVLWDNKDIVDLCKSDRHESLIPLCVAESKTPKEVKDSVSRATWKKLVNGSITKNALIAGWRLQFIGAISLDTLVDVPSTVLYFHKDLDNKRGIEYGTWRELKKKRQLTHFGYTNSVIRDTINMLNTLGKPHNKDWSLARWDEEHTKASRVISLRRQQEEMERDAQSFIPFHTVCPNIYNNLPPVVFDHYGNEARLLVDRKELLEESRIMSHCVGTSNYWQYCQSGEYCVYAVKGRRGERATMGIRILQGQVSRQTMTWGVPLVFSIDQVQGRYNNKDNTPDRSVIDELFTNIKREYQISAQNKYDKPINMPNLPADTRYNDSNANPPMILNTYTWEY